MIVAAAPLVQPACKRTDQAPPALDDKGFDALRAAADAADEKSARLLVEVDRLAPRRAGRGKRAPEPAAFRAREGEQLAAERALDEAIRALYRAAIGAPPHLRSVLLTRTSLLHYAALVRRRVMRPLHTAVPGLADSPQCTGDVVVGRAYQRYFAALALAPEQRVQASILALVELARQSACLGGHQSLVLASALAAAFESLRTFLALNGVEEIVPYVVQAVSQPMVLLYDVEKARGPRSPLARWFESYRDELARGARAHRNPASWHGLWLYDRRSGRLVGFRAVDGKARATGEVRLQDFFTSIARPENLGGRGCTFYEMAERGASARGYFCGASACTERPAVKEADPQLLAQLARSLCAGGAGDTTDVGGSAGCPGAGPGGAGADAALVRCVSQQIASPDVKTMRCLAEATGACANPAGKLVKGMQGASYGGVLMGKLCGRGQPADRSDPPRAVVKGKFRDPLTPEEYQMARDYLRDLARQSEEAWVGAAMEQMRAEEAAKAAADAAAKLPAGSPDKAKADAAAKTAGDAAKAAKEAADKAWSNFAIDLQALRNLESFYGYAYPDQVLAGDSTEPTGTDPDDPGNDTSGDGTAVARCGPDMRCDDRCTAMSDSTRKMLDCMSAALDPGDGTPKEGSLRGCPGPACDPIDPSGSPGRGMACLTDLAQSPGAGAARGCWAVHCAGQTSSVASQCCGRVGAGAGELGLMRDMCGSTDCADGTPVYENGRCQCSDGGSVLTAAGGSKLGDLVKGFDPPTPLTFSEVRFGTRPPPGQGPSPGGPPPGSPGVRPPR